MTRVLVRWATALLAVSGLATAALSVMPDALYRFLAWPNGIAMVALGYSLWQSTRTSAPALDPAPTPRLATTRVERPCTPTRPSPAGPERDLAGRGIAHALLAAGAPCPLPSRMTGPSQISRLGQPP